MTFDFLLSIVFRWMHILAAVVAVGGTIFMRFVLLPSAREALTDEQHAALRGRLIARWKLVVMACITALLVSGLYNFVYMSLAKGRQHAIYHPLFGIKVLAALGVFFIASALTGRSPAFQKMRQNSAHWMLLAAVLGIVVILISGVLSKLPA
jgi:uncharacterized membrane protein